MSPAYPEDTPVTLMSGNASCEQNGGEETGYAQCTSDMVNVLGYSSQTFAEVS